MGKPDTETEKLKPAKNGFCLDGIVWMRIAAKVIPRGPGRYRRMFLLHILVGHCGPHYQTFVTQKTLAKELGCSQGTISKDLQVLEEFDLITRTRTTRGNHVIFVHVLTNQAPPLNKLGLMDRSPKSLWGDNNEKWEESCHNMYSKHPTLTAAHILVDQHHDPDAEEL